VYNQLTILATDSFIALMMEAAGSSKTSVNFYETTQRNIPEDSHLHNFYCTLILLEPLNEGGLDGRGM
jgi:hypothetical protein